MRISLYQTLALSTVLAAGAYAITYDEKPIDFSQLDTDTMENEAKTNKLVAVLKKDPKKAA